MNTIVDKILTCMPIIKSAKKALRQSKRKKLLNLSKKDGLKSLLKQFKKEKKMDLIPKIFSLADKAAKTGTIHKNKAKRIKSQISKIVVSSPKTQIKEKIKKG